MIQNLSYYEDDEMLGEIHSSWLCGFQNQPLLHNQNNHLNTLLKGLFEWAQQYYNPYYVIAIVDESSVGNKKFVAYGASYVKEHPELFPVEDKIRYYAHKCFNFENFKSGEEPSRSTFEISKFVPFLKSEEYPEDIKSNMILGTKLPYKTDVSIRQAQWITADSYFDGIGLPKNQEEAAQWAWCATHASEQKIHQAASMLGFYYYDLTQANGDETKMKNLLRCSGKWFQIACEDNEKDDTSMKMLQ